ncbi:MAG: 2-C-methyl-D-erythritol 4-phosphate cytidylyltransferase [Solirubrobacteraceae bacterium]
MAAGRGERLGYPGPKAFVVVAGRPMLEWSIDALREMAGVEQIVVALPPGSDGAIDLPAGVLTVPGGEYRSQSVRAALGAAAGDPVIVHDAARALATPRIFADALAALTEHGCDAVVAAAPVTDTIKQARDGTVTRTLDRSTLWAAQTPQVFRRAALEQALSASDALLAAATDDAWLVEQAGGSVRIVPSPSENIKITTPGDLWVAETALRRRLGDRAGP